MAGCSLNCSTSARVKTYPFKKNQKNPEAVGLRATEYSDKEVSFNLFLVHLVCTPLPNGELEFLKKGK